MPPDEVLQGHGTGDVTSELASSFYSFILDHNVEASIPRTTFGQQKEVHWFNDCINSVFREISMKSRDRVYEVSNSLQSTTVQAMNNFHLCTRNSRRCCLIMQVATCCSRGDAGKDWMKEGMPETASQLNSCDPLRHHVKGRVAVKKLSSHASPCKLQPFPCSAVPNHFRPFIKPRWRQTLVHVKWSLLTLQPRLDNQNK